MKRNDDWEIEIVAAVFLFLLGIAIGKFVFGTPPVTVNFTFTNATPQNVKGLTTAATETLQKKGVLPGFKEER